MSTLHVRYDGQSHDIDFNDIFTPERLEGIGFTGEFSGNALSADQVKLAFAQDRDIAMSELDDFQVEYHKNGSITLRPDAVFGCRQ